MENNELPTEEIKMAEPPPDDGQSPETGVVKPPEEREALAVTPEVVPWYKKIWRRYISKKKFTVSATVILIILVLAAVPWSRYHAAGLVVKHNLTISVQDSKTHASVSGAAISFEGKTVMTNAEGQAFLPKLKAGYHQVSITKKYYKDQTIRLFSPILSPKNKTEPASLVATGRQIPVTVADYVDGKAVAAAVISVANTTSITDSSGNATLVVPADAEQQAATVTAKGYMDGQFTVKFDPSQKNATAVKLVPSGRVYFFSKRTGKLDLMKSNLDGSDQQTVLAGTGYEQTGSTSISQSPDWRYIALIMKRSAADSVPQLYVLSSSDDRLLSVDSGSANFTLQGWSGDTLLYTVSRTDLPDYQTGKNKLKSYDATSGKITQLDQTKGTNDATGTAWENYSATLVFGDKVVFAKNWVINGAAGGQQHSLNQIDVNGQNYKQIATYAAADKVYYSQHSAAGLYILQQPSSGGTDNYFDYQIGSGAPKQISLDASQFYGNSQGYYPSPSGKSILWSEQRDGKNAILIGDSDGSNPQKIATFSDFLPFGWYTDRYIILTKSSNELYIMSAAGGSSQKISDYQYTNYFF